MQQSELSARLRAWSNEFAAIKGQPVSVPDGLWAFLASRLAEHSGAVQPDPDTVRAKISGEWRMVRITGTRPPGLISYEPADGSMGMGLMQRSDVHADDLGKLSVILERLLAAGRVRDGGKRGFWEQPTEPLERPLTDGGVREAPHPARVTETPVAASVNPAVEAGPQSTVTP